MCIEALLNPTEELHIIEETTDEDICRAVQNARRAQELSQGNGGDDDANDDAQPQADEKFLGLCQPLMDIARKMEALLHTFRQQLHLQAGRNIVVTSITDFELLKRPI
ncbi:hypothetical protein DFH94DRAFT_815365 [Russula ochroleuca]|jgi:hypothetical protein|uniref:Uncharacterized protein n=1 Tax=Russula ochroleuca TaxID=152965 RepID=A0A9P5N3E7_9AGAM|nr:hypothetical protein DFH94DRAFT_815365 [Russula ochroleuca]